MAATTEAKIYVELMDLGELLKRRFPGNPKEHDPKFFNEAFAANGFGAPVMLDEGTGKLMEGHGRLEHLERMLAGGKAAPTRIAVRDGRWLVPTVRGMTFKNPKKHLIALNRGPERGGWNNKALATFLQRLGKDDLVGTGFDADDLASFVTTAPTSFPTVDDNLETKYECPKCQYRWSGSPTPNAELGAKPTKPAKAAAKAKGGRSGGRARAN
ncbi:MAG: hypothetical protein V4537_14160 [Pseudomonadota bacterium]